MAAIIRSSANAHVQALGRAGMQCIDRRTFMASAIAACTLPAWASDTFPSRPIKIIVPLQAGGAADASARIVAAGLQTRVQQPVIVDNKPGGSFVIGMQALSASPADGYTLIALNSGMAAAQATQKRYDMRKSLIPVTKVGITPVLFVVPGQSRFKSLKELVEHCKANPGKINFGSVGIGTLEHLWVTLFSKAVGITVTHIPFKGMPDAMTALVRGELDFVPAVYSQAQPFVEKGMLHAFGVISDRRLAKHPELPTVREQGFDVPPFEFWSGYAVQTGTPAPIVDKLKKDLVAVLTEPATLQRYASLATTIEVQEDFGKLIASDLAWMGATADANGIKLD